MPSDFKNPPSRSAAAAAPAPAPNWTQKLASGLENPGPDYFDGFAKEIAEKLRRDRKNNPHQIRRYYDELCGYVDKIRTEIDFKNRLPLIRMMNAKVAYGVGRELLSREFQEFFSAGLRAIQDRHQLRNFKLLFEAVIGFQKGMD